MYEHNALGYWSGLALCLTKIRSSRARCPATALISYIFRASYFFLYFDPKSYIFPSNSYIFQNAADNNEISRKGLKSLAFIFFPRSLVT